MAMQRSPYRHDDIEIENMVEDIEVNVESSPPSNSNINKRRCEDEEDLHVPPKRTNMTNHIVDSEEDQKPKLNWFAAKCIEYCVQKNLHDLSIEEKGIFESMVQEFKETGVSPSIPYSEDAAYDELGQILKDAMSCTSENTQQRRAPPTSSSKTPLHLFTSTFQNITDDLNGARIIEKAQNWKRTGENSVYQTFSPMTRNNKNQITGTFFLKKGFPSKTDTNSHLLPVNVIEVEKGFDVYDLEDQMKSLPTCIVRGIGKATGMNFDVFDIDVLSEIDPNQKITTIRNRPQHFTTNYNMVQEERVNGGKQLKMDSVVEINKRTLKEYAINYKKFKQIAEKAFSQMRTDPGKISEIAETLMKDLVSAQLPIISERPKAVNPNIPITAFGSNVDIGGDMKFINQLQEIHKLPAFLQYNTGLMSRIAYSIPGVNLVQIYYKKPGSRTPVHLENQALLSVNLNIGPGNCTWICITMSEMVKYEAYLNSNGISQYEGIIWPSEETLIKLGIEYRKIVQRPDDLVFVGIGTLHWVQAENFCTNVAWNIFDDEVTQLRAAALIYDHNRFQNFNSVVPLSTLLWNLAKSKGYEGRDLAKQVKQFLVSSLAHSQFEIDLAELKGYQIRRAADAGNQFTVPSVALCTSSHCLRNSLFNLFVVVWDDEDNGSILCINCVHKKTKDTKHHVYIRYSMKELQDIFDGYNTSIN